MSWFNDYTLRTVILGTSLLGLFSGALGCIAVLRRQSLVGDTLAHASLPGICLAYLLFRSREALPLMLGAAFAGLIAMGIVSVTQRATKTDPNSALGTVLTIFFGAGAVILGIIQRGHDAGQAGLDKFLFGQAASLVTSQVVAIATIGLISLFVFAMVFKEFKLLAFDPIFAESVGLPVRRTNIILTGLLVGAVVVGLNTVGVILLSAMLVAPGVAARQWTDQLVKMVVLAGLFGCLGGGLGAYLSTVAAEMPTGPVVVLVLVAWVVISLIIGPAKGIAFRAKRRQEATS
ncbi:MAG: metal ABC transporter permease [Armatimonadetes bacterium]|nr:metal ABC transporter permease [Armatimonadota bacterium]